MVRIKLANGVYRDEIKRPITLLRDYDGNWQLKSAKQYLEIARSNSNISYAFFLKNHTSFQLEKLKLTLFSKFLDRPEVAQLMLEADFKVQRGEKMVLEPSFSIVRRGKFQDGHHIFAHRNYELKENEKICFAPLQTNTIIAMPFSDLLYTKVILDGKFRVPVA